MQTATWIQKATEQLSRWTERVECFFGRWGARELMLAWALGTIGALKLQYESAIIVDPRFAVYLNQTHEQIRVMAWVCLIWAAVILLLPFWQWIGHWAERSGSMVRSVIVICACIYLTFFSVMLALGQSADGGVPTALTLLPFPVVLAVQTAGTQWHNRRERSACSQ